MPPKWNDESIQMLKSEVASFDDKPVDWEAIGQKLGKPTATCFNKFIQITDGAWTEEEETKLAKLWNDDTSLDEIFEEFKEHKKRAIQFRLENLSKSGKTKNYNIGRDGMREINE